MHGDGERFKAAAVSLPGRIVVAGHAADASDRFAIRRGFERERVRRLWKNGQLRLPWPGDTAMHVRAPQRWRGGDPQRARAARRKNVGANGWRRDNEKTARCRAHAKP